MDKLDVADLVSSAKTDRNRAADFYKATAMVAVAIGHWVAIAVFKDADGGLLHRTLSSSTTHLRGQPGRSR